MLYRELSTTRLMSLAGDLAAAVEFTSPIRNVSVVDSIRVKP